MNDHPSQVLNDCDPFAPACSGTREKSQSNVVLHLSHRHYLPLVWAVTLNNPFDCRHLTFISLPNQLMERNKLKMLVFYAVTMH